MAEPGSVDWPLIWDDSEVSSHRVSSLLLQTDREMEDVSCCSGLKE